MAEAGEKLGRAIELAPHAPRPKVEHARYLIACDKLEEARDKLEAVRQIALVQ